MEGRATARNLTVLEHRFGNPIKKAFAVRSAGDLQSNRESIDESAWYGERRPTEENVRKRVGAPHKRNSASPSDQTFSQRSIVNATC